MKTRLIISILIGLLFSCGKSSIIKDSLPQKDSLKYVILSDSILRDSIFIDNILKDTISGKRIAKNILKELIFYNYPKKWNFNINEFPSYNSIGDSIADYYSSNLGNWEGIVYDFSKININKRKPLDSFKDDELKKIYNTTSKESILSFGYYKWDRPYFVKVLENNEKYVLNLYGSGDKYDKYWNDSSSYNFFVVKYLLVECINKIDKEKKYYLIYLTDNNYLQLYCRYYFIDNNKLTLINFLKEEGDIYFLGRKEYDINFK